MFVVLIKTLCVRKTFRAGRPRTFGNRGPLDQNSFLHPDSVIAENLVGLFTNKLIHFTLPLSFLTSSCNFSDNSPLSPFFARKASESI